MTAECNGCSVFMSSDGTYHHQNTCEFKDCDFQFDAYNKVWFPIYPEQLSPTPVRGYYSLGDNKRGIPPQFIEDPDGDEISEECE